MKQLDRKEHIIINHYIDLFQNRKFDEYDLLGFLITIRRHINANNCYRNIFDAANLIAHRKRNQGIAYEAMNNAIKNNYNKLPQSNRVVGYNGVDHPTEKGLDEAVLTKIDKEIPYHILFILSFEGEYQAWISYKEEAASGSNAFKVGRYYHTDWVTEEKLKDILKIASLSMDAVYENFVRQIAGGALGEGNEESLKESVEKDEKRKNLEKQIAALGKKIKKEKQLNRQMELNGELKKLRKELEGDIVG